MGGNLVGRQLDNQPRVGLGEQLSWQAPLLTKLADSECRIKSGNWQTNPYLTSKIKRALELDYLILKPSLRTYSNKYKFLHEKNIIY
jgi:hypothetical protein